MEALASVVPVKTTGEIGDEGGSLTFIGRVIRREKNSSEITLGVDPHYLDSTFQDYGITNGSSYVPDISGHLERTLSDKNFQKPLSDAAYTRFRKALGKLLWLSQVRHDLKTWMSVLGTQQAHPCMELNKLSEWSYTFCTLTCMLVCVCRAGMKPS